MKTCKKCKSFSDYFCKAFNISITSTANASHCKSYEMSKDALAKEKRTSNIKCSECSSYNFGWCRTKRKTIEEPSKIRSCVKYKKRIDKKIKPRNKKLKC